MTVQNAHNRPRGARSGFSLVELMIALTIAGLVMASMVQMLVANNRLYLMQVESLTSQASLRSAASLLVWELRQASAADLLKINPHRITIRSIVGTGAICARSPSAPIFALTATAGDFTAGSADSVLVFARTGEWKAVGITGIDEAPGTIGACGYVDGRAPEAEVELTVTSAADTADVTIGSPLHTFQALDYGVFERDGSQWFGRSPAGSGNWETLAGPLEGGSGVSFSYYDEAGATTTNAANVAAVEIELRTQGEHETAGGGLPADTAHFEILLRN